MNKVYILLLITTLIYAMSCQTNPYRQGKDLYTAYCASCHMEDGKGLKTLIPPLANADYLKENDEQLACIIRYGLEEVITVNGKQYQQAMLGIPQLSDVEINNILNYIKNAWGNDLGNSKLQDVQQQLQRCKEDQEASSKNSYSK